MRAVQKTTVPSIAKRLWNSSPGSLTRAIKRRAELYRRKPGWFTVKAGPAVGAHLYLPNAEEGSWREMVEGTFDAFLYQAIANEPLSGATCWDVGAHFGYHSLAFSALGARVLAFEPNTCNAGRLRLHLEKNPALAQRIRHVPAAVSDRDGETTLLQSGDLAGASSGSHLVDALPPLGPHVYENFQPAVVPTVRMDTLISGGEAPPTIIKIDVEGGEYLVLMGGRNLLAQHHPVLLIEVHHICLMQRVQQLLQDAGYLTHLLDEENATSSRCFLVARPPHNCPRQK